MLGVAGVGREVSPGASLEPLPVPTLIRQESD